MENKQSILCICFMALALVISSCGTKRMVADSSASNTHQTTITNSSKARQLAFAKKVNGTAVDANSIQAKIKFTVVSGGKDISVGGSLKMKRDDVIRIQLTALGLMEVGRLEFTKDYVLIVDRINKQYIKEDYNKVDFLQRNGLDFYALQALFWNQLFVPGEQTVTDSQLKNFDVTLNEDATHSLLSLKKGNMNYQWEAENATGRISKVDVSYASAVNGNTHVGCTYGNFKTLQSKYFPTSISLKLQSDALKKHKDLEMDINISSFDKSSNWETRTEVSSKYKKVTVEDVLKKLMSM